MSRKKKHEVLETLPEATVKVKGEIVEKGGGVGMLTAMSSEPKKSKKEEVIKVIKGVEVDVNYLKEVTKVIIGYLPGSAVADFKRLFPDLFT